MSRNARLRAYLVAATAAAFLVGVGPAAPGARAATPTASAAPDATAPVIAPAPIAATTAARTPTSARATTTRADKVIAIAKSKLGARWVYGAAGPSVFDCSGLVIYSFRKAGLAHSVGSSREQSAFALYARFRQRGLASRTNGRRGDLVIWGGGTHVGIYLGNGMAISTLVNGVRIHAVRALTTPFTAFLHTGIAKTAAAVTPRRAKPTTTTATATALTVTAHRVATTALRLRSGPSLAARVLSTLAAGTKVGLVRVARDNAGRTWYRVLVGGRLGWLAAWYTRPI